MHKHNNQKISVVAKGNGTCITGKEFKCFSNSNACFSSENNENQKEEGTWRKELSVHLFYKQPKYPSGMKLKEKSFSDEIKLRESITNIPILE